MVPLSVLDLAHVVQDSTPAVALANTVDLAQHVERWGYRRFWLAEHHNMYVGSPQTVRTGLEAVIAETAADELIVASAVYEHAKRLRSYELLAGLAT